MTDIEFFEMLKKYFDTKPFFSAREATLRNSIINRINDVIKKLDKYNITSSEALSCLEEIDSMFYLNKVKTLPNGNHEEYELYPSMTEYYEPIEKALIRGKEVEDLAAEYNLEPCEIREAFLIYAMMREFNLKVYNIERLMEKEKALKELSNLLFLEARQIGGRYYLKYRNMEDDNYIDEEISEEIFNKLRGAL